VRADVAITPHTRYRKAALPTPSEPQSSWTKKRRDVPADGAPGRTFTSRPAPPPSKGSRGRGATSNKGPALLDRPPAAIPARPKAWPALSGQRTRLDEPAQCSMPPSARRQVLLRRTWPFVSLTATRRRFCPRPLEATDAGQPALGRAATARERASPPPSARGAGPGRKRGPTLSRTEVSLSPVFDRDNHAGVIESKNLVNRFSSRAQKPACLSTESPTVGAALTCESRPVKP
jgi:hypothetical protein